MTDQEKIAKPIDWPLWPLLPMIKGGVAGFIHFSNDKRVYLLSIYALDERAKLLKQDKERLTYADLLEGLSYAEYESVDAMLADGWRVD